ncbi:MAG: hypothetical protein E2O84_03625, partial [Bacteroidetes bacterium]
MHRILLLIFCAPMLAGTSFGRQTEDIEIQDARTEKMPERLPELNGHRFFPSSLVGNPFIRSAVRIATGGGYVSDLTFRFEHPELGELLSLRGDLGFLTSELAYEHALDDFV